MPLEFLELSIYLDSPVLDTDNSELLKACGTKVPDKVTSSGNKMTVMFKTDYSQKRKGFKATWKKIPSKIEGGTIKTPNFPSNYPDNVENKVSSIFATGIPYQGPMSMCIQMNNSNKISSFVIH